MLPMPFMVASAGPSTLALIEPVPAISNRPARAARPASSIEPTPRTFASTDPAEPEALIFPDTQYTGDGEAVVYRARWTPVSQDAYEAWSEAQTPDGWTTMFRIVLRRAD